MGKTASNYSLGKRNGEVYERVCLILACSLSSEEELRLGGSHPRFKSLLPTYQLGDLSKFPTHYASVSHMENGQSNSTYSEGCKVDSMHQNL